MRSLLRCRFALVLGVGALVASCSDSPTSPSTEDTPDLTALLTEMSTSVASGAAAAGVPVATGPIAPNACTFSSASGGWFTCPPVTVNGVTFTRRFMLLDDAGNAQSRPNPNIASIRTQTTVNGTVNVSRPGGSGLSFDIARAEDMTLSGIRVGPRKLTGEATSITSGALDTPNGVIHTTSESKEHTLGLILPDRRSGERWPVGRIVVETKTTFSPNGEQGFTSSSVTELTYSRDGTLTIKTTSGFGTVTCTINLANPSPTTCSR